MISKRQLEIVLLVGRDGASWAQVSREMACHPSTIRAHVTRIKERLGIKRKPREAMVIAYHTINNDT